MHELSFTSCTKVLFKREIERNRGSCPAGEGLYERSVGTGRAVVDEKTVARTAVSDVDTSNRETESRAGLSRGRTMV